MQFLQCDLVSYSPNFNYAGAYHLIYSETFSYNLNLRLLCTLFFLANFLEQNFNSYTQKQRFYTWQ